MAAGTGTLVLRSMRQTGIFNRYLQRRVVARVVGGSVLYKAGEWDATRLMQTTAAAVRGIPLASMWQMVERWFDEQLRNVLAPGALEQIEGHYERGHIPLLSAQLAAVNPSRLCSQRRAGATGRF